ncbi:hypothetical protein FQN54_002674 [Arachnomyces sp. PD_36]|nr:hypothetical protein FQN54_002674 [Arachnomyces sp. PD_36]
MSAEAIGESLLAEVREESLNELLNDFNKTYPHRKPTNLGIEPLDELLQIFHGGSAQPRPDRGDPSERTAADIGQRRAELNKETVVEITSPYSGCGKSHLLYYMVAIAILPPSFNDIALNGAESAVVFLDTDGRFDVYRLRDIMVDIVRHKSPHPPGTAESGTSIREVEAMIRDCLHHIHLFRPQSSESLLSTINNLEHHLLHSTDHVSTNRPLHSILLDSANTFYWQDRFQDDFARISTSATGPTTQRHKRPQKQAIKHSLRNLQMLFSCAVIYTTWGLSPQSRHQAGVLSFPPWWHDFPTLRLVVDRDTIRPFGSDMTVDEALRDAQVRHAVVSKGKFSGWVNPWGKNEWASDIPEQLSRTEGKGLFSFWITRDGVAFDQR